jgi:hypothetical protein
MYPYFVFMFVYPDWGFSVFFLSCKANARVKPSKTGHGPHSHKFLCCSMYCLFCVCIVYVYMCSVLQPMGGYPVAVKNISYHNTLEKNTVISFLLMSHHACCHTCYTIQLMHYLYFKTHTLYHLKPIKCWKRVRKYKTPTCFGLFSRPSSGGPPLCFVPLLFLPLTSRQEHQTRTDDIHMRLHTV